LARDRDDMASKPVQAEINIKALNDRYRLMDPPKRIRELYKDFLPEDVMLTSSFAATSAFLLKLFSDNRREQEVHFINTGYHFDETLAYKEHLIKLYGLSVVDVKANKREHEFTQTDETYKKDPNFCCTLNKVNPLEKVKNEHKIWVSGLMKWQSDHRSTLDIFEDRGGIIKFYPLLDVTKAERDQFIEEHKLPFHPLVAKGYQSIGCSHCTVPGEGREGRWNNHPKTECGLHL